MWHAGVVVSDDRGSTRPVANLRDPVFLEVLDDKGQFVVSDSISQGCGRLCFYSCEDGSLVSTFTHTVLCNPTGLAYDSMNSILFIVDDYEEAVHALHMAGRKMRFDPCVARVSSPYAIAVDSEGNELAVIDRSVPRVVFFELGTYEEKGSVELPPQICPVDIRFSGGEYVVCDGSRAHMLFRINENGDVSHFVPRLSGERHFEMVSCVHVGDGDEYLAATSSLLFLFEWGGRTKRVFRPSSSVSDGSQKMPLSIKTPFSVRVGAAPDGSAQIMWLNRENGSIYSVPAAYLLAFRDWSSSSISTIDKLPEIPEVDVTKELPEDTEPVFCASLEGDSCSESTAVSSEVGSVASNGAAADDQASEKSVENVQYQPQEEGEDEEGESDVGEEPDDTHSHSEEAVTPEDESEKCQLVPEVETPEPVRGEAAEGPDPAEAKAVTVDENEGSVGSSEPEVETEPEEPPEPLPLEMEVAESIKPLQFSYPAPCNIFIWGLHGCDSSHRCGVHVLKEVSTRLEEDLRERVRYEAWQESDGDISDSIGVTSLALCMGMSISVLTRELFADRACMQILITLFNLWKLGRVEMQPVYVGITEENIRGTEWGHCGVPRADRADFMDFLTRNAIPYEDEDDKSQSVKNDTNDADDESEYDVVEELAEYAVDFLATNAELFESNVMTLDRSITRMANRKIH